MKTAFCVKQLKAYIELHAEHVGQLARYFSRHFHSSVRVHLAADNKQSYDGKSLPKDGM